MATYAYDDYRVTFSPRADGGYDVRAADAEGAECAGTFHSPLSDADLEGAVRGAVAHARGAAPEVTRDVGDEALPVLDAEHVGAALADALLAGPVGAGYDAARAAAAARGHGLRLSLSLAGAPALLSVPWEFLYRRPRFLASQRKTPLVRLLDTGAMTAPAVIDSTVRILGVIASPHDLPPLDVAKERQGVEEAVARTRELGRVQLDWLEPATPRRLREALRDGTYHVLHFIGHSDFTDDGRGLLYLQDDDGTSEAVDETLFANLLSDQDQLRLVVLNSCEGARTTLTDPYAGVATTLVSLGVPAVVAMQFEISDRAAIVFAQELYLNLIGRQDPIDAAIAEARKAIYSEVDPIEWATPVLFVRDPDVELFRFAVPAAPLPPPPPPDTADQPVMAIETTPPIATPRGGGGGGGGARRAWLVAAAVVVGVVVAGVVVLLTRAGGAPDDATSPTVGLSAPTATAPSGPAPRPRTGFFAVQVGEPDGDVHLLTVDPTDASVGTASDRPGSHDTEPDWDRETNRLAFRRAEPSPNCTGLCYVVPGNNAGDKGKQVAQLVPFTVGRLQHAPSWSTGSTLFYARTDECAPGPGCAEEIRRVAFAAADDGTGFGDDLTTTTDDLVASDVADVRDLDADPQDPGVVAMADGDGVALVTSAGVRRLPTTSAVTQVAFTPDGSLLVAAGTAGDASVLEVWSRGGDPLGVVDATATRTFVDDGGELGAGDPAQLTVASMTTGRGGTSLNVLFDDRAAPSTPVLTAVDVTAQGTAAITSASGLPSEVLAAGAAQAVAR